MVRCTVYTYEKADVKVLLHCCCCSMSCFNAEERQSAGSEFGEDGANFDDEREEERNADGAVKDGSQLASLCSRYDVPVADRGQQRHAVLHGFPEFMEFPA